MIKFPKPDRKPRKAAKTDAERRYHDKVAELGCAVCRRLGWGATPAVVHHQRTGQGWGRADHYDVAPLCPEHHDGKTGVHSMGRDEFTEMYGFSEVDLVEETKLLLMHCS